MTKIYPRAIFLPLLVLIAGLSFNFWFMWRTPGLNVFAYFLVSVLIVQVAKLWQNAGWRFHSAEVLYIPVGLISLTPLLQQNGTLNTLAALLVWVVGTNIALLAAANKRLSTIGIVDILGLRLVGYLLSFAPTSIWNNELSNILQSNPVGRSIFWRVLAGLVVGIPFAFFIFLLLAAADPAFARILSLNTLAISFSTFVELIVLFGICLLWFGVVASTTYRNSNLAKDSINKIDWVVTIIVSVLTNVVLVCFVVVQFVYLFGGSSLAWNLNIPYSAYATKGFWEITVVASIVVSMVYVFRRFGESKLTQLALAARANLTISVLCTLVLLLSAWTRLSIYTDAYGLSPTRFFVQAYLVFLGVALLYLAVGVWSRWVMRYLPIAILCLMSIFMLGVSVINPEAHVTRVNLTRLAAGQTEPNIWYNVGELTSDGYAEILLQKGCSAESYDIAFLERITKEHTASRSSLQSFNLAELANRGRLAQWFDLYWNEPFKLCGVQPSQHGWGG